MTSNKSSLWPKFDDGFVVIAAEPFNESESHTGVTVVPILIWNLDSPVDVDVDVEIDDAGLICSFAVVSLVSMRNTGEFFPGFWLDCCLLLQFRVELVATVVDIDIDDNDDVDTGIEVVVVATADVTAVDIELSTLVSSDDGFDFLFVFRFLFSLFFDFSFGTNVGQLSLSLSFTWS